MTGFAALSGPLLLAHRGARLLQPENTLVAFEAALRAGADVIETDVHMTRDGHVVLAHDPDGARTAGMARAIKDCSLAEVQAWQLRSAQERGAGDARARVPTLDEALAAFPSACFNVDVKQARPDMLAPLLALIARHRAAERVLLTSFSARVTHRIAALGYTGPLGVSQRDAALCLLAPRPLARVAARGARRLQIPPRYGPLALDRRAVAQRAHGLGLALDYWVINDVAHAAQLLARGADGIVTDDPAALAKLFARAPETAAWRARHPSPPGAPS